MAAQSGETQLCLGIRPEHVHLQAGAAENAILGTLRYVEDYGNKRGAYVSVGDTEIVCICDRLPCAPGGVVSFALDSEHIHLFSRETTQSLAIRRSWMKPVRPEIPLKCAAPFPPEPAEAPEKRYPIKNLPPRISGAAGCFIGLAGISAWQW